MVAGKRAVAAAMLGNAGATDDIAHALIATDHQLAGVEGAGQHSQGAVVDHLQLPVASHCWGHAGCRSCCR